MCNMVISPRNQWSYGTLRTGRGPTLPIELGPWNMWFVSFLEGVRITAAVGNGKENFVHEKGWVESPSNMTRRQN